MDRQPAGGVPVNRAVRPVRQRAADRGRETPADNPTRRVVRPDVPGRRRDRPRVDGEADAAGGTVPDPAKRSRAGVRGPVRGVDRRDVPLVGDKRKVKTEQAGSSSDLHRQRSRRPPTSEREHTVHNGIPDAPAQRVRGRMAREHVRKRSGSNPTAAAPGAGGREDAKGPREARHSRTTPRVDAVLPLDGSDSERRRGRRWKRLHQPHELHEPAVPGPMGKHEKLGTLQNEGTPSRRKEGGRSTGGNGRQGSAQNRFRFFAKWVRWCSSISA